MSKKIILCALSNVSNGNCSEDCKFCTQSVANSVAITPYKNKSLQTLLEEAKAAKQNEAKGFCLVTAGLALSKATKKHICQAAQMIKKEVDINLIGCNGLATLSDLQDLKSAGFDAYNHNLETEESFYSTICSSHSWQKRYETCENVNKAGLRLIAGGIFGLGESEAQREKFLHQIHSLSPKRVPINFFIPHDGLPIKQPIMSEEEALAIIQKARVTLPQAILMVAGGREVVFGKDWPKIFEAGADSIVIGDYLTAKGFHPSSDREKILKAGYTIG